jgi:hypothetical protein
MQVDELNIESFIFRINFTTGPSMQVLFVTDKNLIALKCDGLPAGQRYLMSFVGRTSYPLWPKLAGKDAVASKFSSRVSSGN